MTRGGTDMLKTRNWLKGITVLLALIAVVCAVFILRTAMGLIEN